MKECTCCNGTGQNAWNGKECYACHGRGRFPAPNYAQILEDICTARGQFRRSKPPLETNTIRGARAYYVWRLARFHGGVDVTMPILAETIITGDPYADDLDRFAGKVAEIVFGTQLAAAMRWGSILGYVERSISGLPASAYAGGPVLLSDGKPITELAELL